MDIEKDTPRDDVVILRIDGRVDADSAPQLKERLEGEASHGLTILVVDLAGVDFMDSSGLSALVAGHKAVRQAGAGVLRLSRPNPQALTALKLTLLDTVIPVFASIEDAIQESPGPPA